MLQVLQGYLFKADGSLFDDVRVGRNCFSAASLKLSLKAPSLTGAMYNKYCMFIRAQILHRHPLIGVLDLLYLILCLGRYFIF